MNLFKPLFALLFVVTALISFGQPINKKPLTHSVYDSWKAVSRPMISNNGEWAAFEIYPQVGDGWLHLQRLTAQSRDSVFRGQGAVLSSASDMMAFTLKQPTDTIRKLKLAKTKKDDLPKDSLGIWVFNKDTIYRYAGLKSFQMPKDGGAWVAWLWEKPKEKPQKAVADTTKPKTDTLAVKPKPSSEKEKEKKKKKGAFADIDVYKLSVFNPVLNKKYDYDSITESGFSQNGNLLGFVKLKKDSIDVATVKILDTQSGKAETIFEKAGLAQKIALDKEGKQLAFLFTADTTKIKRYGLYLCDLKNKTPRLIADTASAFMRAGWEVSENATVNFSDDGSKLYFGTAFKRPHEVKDTLLEEEKTKLDVWSWKDARLQTQQLKELDDDMKKSYLAVCRIAENKVIQLSDSTLQNIRTLCKGDAEFALGSDPNNYEILQSWEGKSYRDYYFVDLKTGARKLLLQKWPERADLSPTGKYLYFYNGADSSWNTLQVATGKRFNLTKTISTPFYNEENDVPDDPNPYGIAGWTPDDASMLVYDRYDIWQLNPENKISPVSLTANGRNTKTVYRYIKLDNDIFDIPVKEPLLLDVVKEESCQEGFASLRLNEPGKQQLLLLTGNQYSQPIKAKNSNNLLWQRSSYTEYNDLWTSSLAFNNARKLSVANPQQNQYWWGTVEQVSWQSFDGGKLKGLLYKPENFDPSKKYPMIVYFYEKYSNSLNTYYVPAPTRSIVNFPYYNSNGYIVFVPDVNYRTGEPGPSAYDDIISGTLEMTKLPYVDASRMGIQGQSWGGYQVSYLVTRTGMFKAAMAGAPVSNMTSAYGGIRWESGLVRQFQYEHGQSRIGSDLWHGREKYIENSAIFFADRITTPLLIMANDNDGAVPWYQGIELITALRRLQKPAWLLCYNGEQHNLVKRPNRMDLSIRTSEFFDHYLKDAPMPKWMKEGIPAVQKGKILGY